MNANEKTRVLVTGAAGTVGGRVCAQLAAAGADVRAATRYPERLKKSEHIQPAAVDLTDPDSLARAVDDTDAVFLIWPFFDAVEDARRKVAPIAEILGNSVPRVVYLSSQGVEKDRRNFWSVVEDAVAARVDTWTMLRPTGFAANARQWIPQLAEGDVVRWPFGRMARPLIHESDIATVAVDALLHDGHAGEDIVITGPELISQEAQIHAIGAATGRVLRWEEISRKQAAAEFGLSDMMLDAWEGFITDPEPVTDAVGRLTDRPALTFAEWACEHADDFR